ncbi:hypothetical protein [Okeania sp. KiyG1]|uniref:hypothetical protein n=1 Tax=Okeania sp. KiyG1 TaxID=2720165 RepID=UPI00192064AB|nr:hypothetical protein [Okeania sp. KiyG1]GGA36805.1 hypothetical protein CYANOKiyG1_54800 [Okeania sp. KiyG1]
MATKTTKKKQTKTSTKCGRPGGNPDLLAYRWKPKVPGKPKSNNLTVRVDDDMFNGIKNISGWQDKLRAKIDELLQEENAQNYQTGDGVGLVGK